MRAKAEKLARENKRGGGKSRLTGWHAQGRDRMVGDFSPVRYAARSTAWERKVRALGLSEADAHELVKLAHGPGAVLREFVRKVFTRRFVPESVLEAMGLQFEVESARGLSLLRDDGGVDE
jgi:hypothetical protein